MTVFVANVGELVEIFLQSITANPHSEKTKKTYLEFDALTKELDTRYN
jgi:hypothetical protein